MDVEERLVADRLEGVPIPAESTLLTGHDAVLEKLISAYRSGRMHHAWLLTGPRGIGKSTLAFHFAKYVMANPIEAQAPPNYQPDSVPLAISRQVAQGAHPDLLHLTRPWDEKTKRFKTQLSVDEIRKTQSFYGMTAGAGGWRISIIDAADDMNANAANALLKILEEPPKRSLFFIISHVPGSLLPTTRSRCQTLHLSPLQQNEVEQVLGSFELELADHQAERASALSNGSVRLAINLAQGAVLSEYADFEKLMNTGATGHATDWTNAHRIADALSKRGQEDAFAMFIDLTSRWIAEQVRSSSQPDITTLAALADIWEDTSRSARLANAYNLDRKQVILSLFSSLFEHNKR